MPFNLLLTIAIFTGHPGHRLCGDGIGILMSPEVSAQTYRAVASALVDWNRALGYAVFVPDPRGRVLVEEAVEPELRIVRDGGCVAAAVISLSYRQHDPEFPRYVRRQFGRVLGLTVFGSAVRRVPEVAGVIGGPELPIKLTLGRHIGVWKAIRLRVPGSLGQHLTRQVYGAADVEFNSHSSQ